MRRLFMLSWIGSLLAGHTARALDAPQALLGPGSRAVVVGMLSWKDKGLAAFDAQGRKDRELAEALSERVGLARGADTLLPDGAATRAGPITTSGWCPSASVRPRAADVTRSRRTSGSGRGRPCR